MCWFFIAIKVLMLKLLLSSLAGLTSSSAAAYEYGYHPSAEEFDNLLRETHRTWTHDILNQQQQRRLHRKVPSATTIITTSADEVKRSFVPKFQYESHLNKFNKISQNTNNNNNPNPSSHDLQASPSHNRVTIQNLGSSLDFHYINGPGDDHEANMQPLPFNFNSKPKETKVQLTTTAHTMPELNLKPVDKPEMEKYSLNNLYKNNTQAHFPIYFTNPATGIVYAITEMGKSSANASRTNGSIPIFITKEQYERDILLLKEEYESHCALTDKNKLNILSSFSRPSTTTTSTTVRPQIIRIQRPAITSTSSTSKLITPLKKPSPVIVKTELNVKDNNRHTTTVRPTKRKNKPKPKRKAKKKSKPPGHQKLNTTPRPGVGGPSIIMGTRTTTRRPYSDAYKLSTQLEKPNFGTTIFSTSPLAATASNMGVNEHLHFNNLERNRRSIGEKEIEIERKEDEIINSQNIEETIVKRDKGIPKKSNKISGNVENLNKNMNKKQNLHDSNSTGENYLNIKNVIANEEGEGTKLKNYGNRNKSKNNKNRNKSKNYKNLNKSINNENQIKSKNIENLNKSINNENRNKSKNNKNLIKPINNENLNESHEIDENIKKMYNFQTKWNKDSILNYGNIENFNKNVGETKSNQNVLNSENINKNRKFQTEQNKDLNGENSNKNENKQTKNKFGKIQINTGNLNKKANNNLDTPNSKSRNILPGFRNDENRQRNFENTSVKSKDIGIFIKNIESVWQNDNVDMLNSNSQTEPPEFRNDLVNDENGQRNFGKNSVKSKEIFQYFDIQNFIKNIESLWQNENVETSNLKSENKSPGFRNDFMNSENGQRNLENTSVKSKENVLKSDNTIIDDIRNSINNKEHLWHNENVDTLNLNVQNKSPGFRNNLIKAENGLTTFLKLNENVLKSDKEISDDIDIRNTVKNKESLWKNEKVDTLNSNGQNKSPKFRNNLENGQPKYSKTFLKSKGNVLKSDKEINEHFDIGNSIKNKFGEYNININLMGKENTQKENAKDYFQNSKTQLKIRKLQTINENPYKNEHLQQQYPMFFIGMTGNNIYSKEQSHLKNSIDFDNKNSETNKNLKNSHTKSENFVKCANENDACSKTQIKLKNVQAFWKNPYVNENTVDQKYINQNLDQKKSFKSTENPLKFENTKNVKSKRKNIFGEIYVEIPNKSDKLYSRKPNEVSDYLENIENLMKKNFQNKKSPKNKIKSMWKSENYGEANVERAERFSNKTILNIDNLNTNLNFINQTSTQRNSFQNLLKLLTEKQQNGKMFFLEKKSKFEMKKNKNNEKSNDRKNYEQAKEKLSGAEKKSAKNTDINNISQKVNIIENFYGKENIMKIPKLFKNSKNSQDNLFISEIPNQTDSEPFKIKENKNNTKSDFQKNLLKKNTLKSNPMFGVASIPKDFLLNNKNHRDNNKKEPNSKNPYLPEKLKSEEMYPNKQLRNKRSLPKVEYKFQKNHAKPANMSEEENVKNISDDENLLNVNKIKEFQRDDNERTKSKNPNNPLQEEQRLQVNTTDSFKTHYLHTATLSEIHQKLLLSYINNQFKNLNPSSEEQKLVDPNTTNYLKPATLSEIRHIHKRSVDTMTQSAATVPKFIRKSKNATKETFLEINQKRSQPITNSPTSNFTNSQERLSRKTENSKRENFVATKPKTTANPTNKNNRTTTNSKITNFKKSSASRLKKRKKNRKSQNRTKTLKKRKRVKVATGVAGTTTSGVSGNSTVASNIETTTPRSLKKDNPANKRAKISQEDNEEDEYVIFAAADDDDDDDDEEDEDADEDYSEENEDDDDDKEYEDQEFSDDDLEEKPIADNSSLAEESADYGAMLEEQTDNTDEDNTIPTTPFQQVSQIKYSDIRKRYRRRPPPNDYDDDEDDEEDDSAIGSNLGGFFRMIFYPVQMVFSGIMDSLAGGGKDPEDESPSPYTQYTSYHNTLKQHSNDDYTYDDDEDADYDNYDSGDSSLTGWFSSLFGLNRRNKKIGSTTVAPSEEHGPAKQSNWFQSWFGFGGGTDGVDKMDTAEEGDAYDKWFASWFGDIKPKARKRTTTTTSTTTQLPHVPILTIVDPMRNPQNWIGILAHHIINHTSTTTQNPLKDIWAKVTAPTTTTTTENPDIPRKISYNKYQIWRLKPQDDSQVQALEEYKKGDDGIKLQWLKGPSLRGLTDVLVPPRMLVDFQASLTFESIDHEVLIFDVGKAIAYEKSKEDHIFTTTQSPKKRHKHNRYTNKPQPAMTWMRYYEFDDIVTYLENMRMRYPQLVELIHIGRSYEGRPLIVMKIESKEAAATNSANLQMNEKSKLRNRKRIGLANAVFIEAGVHGTEWIAPATATWIINELLKTMKNNKTTTDEQSLIRNTTWYIMPVLNPDGYVYSHEYDRFWKKSRSRHISRPSGLINSAMTWLQKKKAKEKVCFGVDLDRNWNYQWGKRGSSRTPCNEFYSGPGPFSEPETKALSEFLMDYRTHIKLYISMQSYGQIISYPYKANTTYDTERLDDFLDVAMVGTDGLRKKGSKARYKIDSTNDLVENRSGSSDAFVAFDVGIPFSYTLHLADNGVHGYLLPSAAIESTSRDAFEIIIGMLDYI